MSNKFEIRSPLQYELLFAISLIEKARYLSESSQQLSYDILKSLLPILKDNYNKIESIASGEIEYDLFHLNLNFVLNCCLHSHRKVIRAIELSCDNRTLYDNICAANKDKVLGKLCNILNTLWIYYWKHFHKNDNKMDMLLNLQSQLVPLFSAITFKGNESLPSDYRCLSCIIDSAFTKTGRLNMCDNDNKNQDKSNSQGISLNYCYHLVDTKMDSKFCNFNRAIFERRLNEIGLLQH